MLTRTMNMFVQVIVYTYNRTPHILAQHIQHLGINNLVNREFIPSEIILSWVFALKIVRNTTFATARRLDLV